MKDYTERHDCQYCGISYVAYSVDSKYCSTGCEDKAENPTEEIDWWDYV